MYELSVSPIGLFLFALLCHKRSNVSESETKNK
jgi:hypothetical protein